MPVQTGTRTLTLKSNYFKTGTETEKPKITSLWSAFNGLSILLLSMLIIIITIISKNT